MKSILVTGAAGFIGSTLVDALIDRGDKVTGIDDFNSYYDPAIKRENLSLAIASDAFRLREGDICDEAFVRGVFEESKPEVVVHLAARAGVRPSLEDPNLYHRVNVFGTQNILDACRAPAISHLVFASSSSVYGGIAEVPFTEDMDISRTISPYAATKRMNELMCHVHHHVYGLRVSILRFFTVYGPRQRPDMAIHKFTRLIEEDHPVPMFGDGSTQRDYTYIDDIVQGVVRAIDRPHDFEIFNLGENQTTSLRELIALIGAATGKTPMIEEQALQPGDVEVTYASIEKARRMLGYDPQTTMADGIARFVEWYRAAIA